MSRIAGRQGRIYANVTSAGTPEPIAFLNNWGVTFETDKIDVTSFGDSNRTYVSSLPNAAGTYSGFYDDATTQFYTAATDGVARKFYLYPSTSLNTQYWFGTAIFDFSVQAAVDGAVEVNGAWSAATIVAKVG